MNTGGRQDNIRDAKAKTMSTPVENLTDPPVENLTDRRGDEPQVVVASWRAGVRRPRRREPRHGRSVARRGDRNVAAWLRSGQAERALRGGRV